MYYAAVWASLENYLVLAKTRKETASGATGAVPNAAETLHRRANQVDWDWENANAHAVANETLAIAAPYFGQAVIKPKPDDENIELRGSFDGAPIRFAVWMTFGSFWAIEMRCTNSFGEIEILRDLEKVPKAKQAGDPWDDDEERRVFVAKGIFIEGYDHDIEEKLNSWQKVPFELQERVCQAMERLSISEITVSSDTISLTKA